jgi:hypothetical protein
MQEKDLSTCWKEKKVGAKYLKNIQVTRIRLKKTRLYKDDILSVFEFEQICIFNTVLSLSLYPIYALVSRL